MKIVRLFLFVSLLVSVDSYAQPNVVLIVSDNQSPNLMGAYGNKDILTPSLDKLADAGVLFERAYAVSGVCSPTRATLLTGLLPSQTGVHNGLPSVFPIKHWSAISEFRNLPQTLSDSGYKTAMIGKYHLGDSSKPQLGFDEWVVLGTGLTSSFYGARVLDNGKQYTVKKHLTDFWTDKGVEFIQKQTNKTPFFLYLSYNGPYALPPLITQKPQNRHAQHYTQNMPAMPQEPVHPYLRQFAIETSSKEEVLLRQQQLKRWNVEDKTLTGKDGRLDPSNSLAWMAIGALNNKTAMINLASQMSMVDDGVDKIMSALEAHGFDDNTIVIFTSDHGAEYGKHGLWGNGTWSKPAAAFNDTVQVPLIVHLPGQKGIGQRSPALINQFDIFPTILDLLGMNDKKIVNTPGQSFAPLITEERDPAWRNTVFYEHIDTRAIVKPGWKYIARLFGQPSELYDLSKDPDEKNNLIADKKYRKIQQDLRDEMMEFFEQYADPKYDPWRGGTAKAVLMYKGKNDDFKNTFPNWVPPFVEANEIFSDMDRE